MKVSKKVFIVCLIMYAFSVFVFFTVLSKTSIDTAIAPKLIKAMVLALGGVIPIAFLFRKKK